MITELKGPPSSLCGFCDASMQAHAAVIYLVIESDIKTEARKVSRCKTRVAPLQSQTAPRLELFSAFLLSKLATSVVDSLSSTLPPVLSEVLHGLTDRVLCFGFGGRRRSGSTLLAIE